MPADDFNPYAPPTAGTEMTFAAPEVVQDYIPASRGTRLGARILDGLLGLASAVPFIITTVSLLAESSQSGTDGGDMAVLIMLLATVPMAVFYGFQCYLIAHSGQTLGKRWLGIKVVKRDGSPVNFVSGVVLREWVLGIVSAIPNIGGLISLVDALMIFGQQQMCLHDHIAKTRVILVPPPLGGD